MARPPKLNWDVTRSKWRVVYKGRKFRFDGGAGKSDRTAKKNAEEAWKRLKSQLDQEAENNKPHRAEYENVMAEWTSVLTWAVEHGDEATAAVARDKLQNLEERLSARMPPPLSWADRFSPTSKVKPSEPYYQSTISGDGDHKGILIIGRPVTLDEPTLIPSGYVEPMLWSDRLRSQAIRLEESGRDDTFAANVEQFLRMKQNEVAAGQLSAGRAEALRSQLDVVMAYTGRTTSVRRIDGATLLNFRNHLLGRLAAKEISDYYARDVFSSFKLFVRWLAGNTDKLENLPRNIEDRKLKFSIAKRKVQLLTNDEVSILLQEARDRTKLYLLLGLNCAMTQIDMADLHPDEVDWNSGVITRRRSKTAGCENVPEVSYPLWPETFDLLKKERSDDPRRVLLTRDRRPLRTETVTSSNKYQKTDAVRLAVRVLAKKTGIGFTVKSLKKSSASRIGNHRDYKGLESLFLDHAPQTVAARHYTAVPQELLSEAIGWLGRDLKIVTNADDTGQGESGAVVSEVQAADSPTQVVHRDRKTPKAG